MNKKSNIDVSIVVVCMNNLDFLFPCLDSIYKNSEGFSFEILVVAYFFTSENLYLLKEKYPQVIIIESNEIRGFSENNNLALEQVNGSYAFILNDDTYFKVPVISKLLNDFKSLPLETACVSPLIHHIKLNRNFAGRSQESFLFYLMKNVFGSIGFLDSERQFQNRRGIYQTYTFSGCAFLIRMDVFKSVGLFDEKYFFSPEDLALSDLLNKKGYKCYIDADVEITHLKGATFSKTSFATFPAAVKGEIIFRSQNNYFYEILLEISFLFKFIIAIVYFSFQKTNENKIALIRRYRNAIYGIFSKKSPKELFVKFYKNKYE